jgi:O-acetyl-ADP-ribose deacetylase (regulator of RNase III)
MIELKQGDILRANAEALVNTVNCVGVMGRGLALQFKKVFPDNFKSYKAACDNKALQPGKMFIYDLNRLYKPHYVVNFPTKRHWKGMSRMEDIAAGLQTLVEEVRKRDIHSIAIHPLGCGLGGLRWPDVRAKIEEAFQDLPDVQVLLYEPKGAMEIPGLE